MPKRAKGTAASRSAPRSAAEGSTAKREQRGAFERPAATVWRQALLAVAAGAFLAWITFLIVLAVQG
jgi:hypothetical protein